MQIVTVHVNKATQFKYSPGYCFGFPQNIENVTSSYNIWLQSADGAVHVQFLITMITIEDNIMISPGLM